MMKTLLGEQHPDTAICLNNLALLYGSQGKYKEAETLYLDALTIALNTLGKDHPQTKTFRNNLEKFLMEVIQTNKTDILSNHPFMVNFMKIN